eukprot:CAMPEP_0184289138 /NCGR_PEP_ID=MMETSP1049-20130417/1581_1 /TAXON_ID=77928 /ORGANISM="Proteomonas sulcata, Strain CCMP704" /LENGTH=80 /DNA_ID=CAMNT_0026595799 /DNA_START=471 /DNA_END=713 /DNA_ORIENTATION=+
MKGPASSTELLELGLTDSPCGLVPGASSGAPASNSAWLWLRTSSMSASPEKDVIAARLPPVYARERGGCVLPSFCCVEKY